MVAVADAAEHLEETLQSIQFGQRAMRVQTKAKINESVGRDLLNADLLKRLSSMDISSCVVDANLLAKEEELRAIQEALAVHTPLFPFQSDIVLAATAAMIMHNKLAPHVAI